MRLFSLCSSLNLSSAKEQNGDAERSRALLYLNVYDLTPINNYLYWFGLGIFHSGIEASFVILEAKLVLHGHTESSDHETFIMNDTTPCIQKSNLALNITTLKEHSHAASLLGLGIRAHTRRVHGLEYGFGAHEYASSGVFEVEPRSCPGFTFRRSILLGSTDMTRAEFHSFMEDISGKYHGDTYHLITKNCNHFTDEVCMQLTGKSIPAWVNRLARVGSFCNCLLPGSILITTVRHLPDHQSYSDEESVSVHSSSVDTADEELDQHLWTMTNSDMAFLKDKPVRLAKEVL